MPGAQDLLKLSLVSKRQDIINFTGVFCSDGISLTVAPDFYSTAFSENSLLLIDATLFNDFDLGNLESGETFAAFSICILPLDLPPQLIHYVENNFKYIISYPVNKNYFLSYCRRVWTVLSNMRKDYFLDSDIRKIPESFSGYFCGNSVIIKNVRSQILTASYTSDPVLILGETGTGKTTAAQVIHKLSERKKRKMISVSLSTVVETLAESAFFGHRRGSYTNAEYDSRGYFEQADGSTLFLDEFGIASPSVQAMLLTVLETGNYKKVGDDEEQHADVRMIFATNSDIEKMLNTGRFRSDLYFRICDNIIRIPPLRKHKEDVRGMVLGFLGQDIEISEQALEMIEDYDWPGNIRELHKCLRRARKNCRNGMITADSIDLCEISFPR